MRYSAACAVTVSDTRSVSRNFRGSFPCLMEVMMRLGRILWVFSPVADRVPNMSFLMITRKRIDCSAWLLVGGTPGWRRKVNKYLPIRKARRVSEGAVLPEHVLNSAFFLVRLEQKW